MQQCRLARGAEQTERHQPRDRAGPAERRIARGRRRAAARQRRPAVPAKRQRRRRAERRGVKQIEPAPAARPLHRCCRSETRCRRCPVTSANALAEIARRIGACARRSRGAVHARAERQRGDRQRQHHGLVVERAAVMLDRAIASAEAASSAEAPFEPRRRRSTIRCWKQRRSIAGAAPRSQCRRQRPQSQTTDQQPGRLSIVIGLRHQSRTR